uniref:Uncharacterized protein n=1 Tax=viral metagenome TaxID=1070528 RepID=A0A6C0H6L6_9ZZZZ
MNWITYSFVIILFVVYFFVSKETLENTKTKTVKQLATCTDCKIYNHRDARSKCDKLCDLTFPEKNAVYNGNWIGNEKGATCECQYQGAYKKQFVGCPIGEELPGHPDCFLWNQSDANNKCHFICNKYIPGKQSVWTSEWKNTSSSTSACECEYYD